MGLLNTTLRGVQTHRTRLLPWAFLVAFLLVAALVLPATRDRVVREPVSTAGFVLLVLFVIGFWAIPSDFTRRMRKNPL